MVDSVRRGAGWVVPSRHKQPTCTSCTLQQVFSWVGRKARLNGDKFFVQVGYGGVVGLIECLPRLLHPWVLGRTWENHRFLTGQMPVRRVLPVPLESPKTSRSVRKHSPPILLQYFQGFDIFHWVFSTYLRSK